MNSLIEPDLSATEIGGSVPATDAGLPRSKIAALPVTIFSSDWAPALAFAYSLGRRGVPLHFYGSGASRWSRYSRRRGVCPPVSRADEFLTWLRNRLRTGEISRIAPTTDLIAYYMAVLRDEFPSEVRRSITPLDEIERCLIKTRFADACEKCGQMVPPHAAPESLDAAVKDAYTLGFPLIIKPKSHLVVGSKERGHLVRNADSLRKHFRRYSIAPGQEAVAATYPELEFPLLQRYIPNARSCVYSVSGIKDADRGIIAATLTCKRQQWPPDIGVSTVQSRCHDQRILDAGLATANALLSCGIFELELISDGDKLLAIDLNPRAFGFIALDMEIGNDLPWLWWQTTTNTVRQGPSDLPFSELDCRFVVPYYFGQFINRLFHPVRARTASSSSARETPWVSMLGHRGDPLPMLLANLRLLKLLPHPGGLIRPYLAAAWQARRDTRNQVAH